MFRLFYFLLMMYLIYRALKYFFRLFSGQRYPQNNPKRDSREIIDIDYEEIKDEGNSNKESK